MPRYKPAVSGGGKAPAAVPGFTGYQDTYHVFLPPDTPQSAVIALKGVPAHQEAKVVGNPQITLSRGAGAASLTVAAQEDTVQKNYTVNFTVTGKNGTSDSSGDSIGRRKLHCGFIGSLRELGADRYGRMDV